MTDKKTIDTTDERRRFFRIEDLIHLTYRMIDKSVLEERVKRLDQGLVEQFMVMSSLSSITADMAATLRKIEISDPDLASYLKALDHKIDLIGKTFMIEEVSATANKAEPVNLSASGIAFNSNEIIAEGTAVEIKMMLLPSCSGILAYGEVVGNGKVEDDSGFQNQVRIDFTHLRDEDRDMLIKHVIKKQGDMLRERRMAREREDY